MTIFAPVSTRFDESRLVFLSKGFFMSDSVEEHNREVEGEIRKVCVGLHMGDTLTG